MGSLSLVEIKNMKSKLFLIISLIVGINFSILADSDKILNTINDLFRTSIYNTYGQSFITHANYLMGMLALFQVIWTIAWLTIKSQELDSIVATTLKQVIIIGFFYTLLLNGGQWLPAILNSFINQRCKNEHFKT